MEKFKYINNPRSYNPENAFIAHLSGVRNKDELLEQLNIKLKFPEYFGFNWDALLDVLCDFHWIKQKKVVLIHDDFPRLNEQELTIYLQILFDSIQAWKGCEKHIIEVVFPECAKYFTKHDEC